MKIYMNSRYVDLKKNATKFNVLARQIKGRKSMQISINNKHYYYLLIRYEIS